VTRLLVRQESKSVAARSSGGAIASASIASHA
jgi:hypothetical protein